MIYCIKLSFYLRIQDLLLSRCKGNKKQVFGKALSHTISKCIILFWLKYSKNRWQHTFLQFRPCKKIDVITYDMMF